MKRFIAGEDRGQSTLFPERLDEYIGEDNPVRVKALEVQMLATPDQQISLTDPDARSMATSGRGPGVVGYNVQAGVDIKHHLIAAHKVTNEGTDRSQLAPMGRALLAR